jgi:hypothetical protein
LLNFHPRFHGAPFWFPTGSMTGFLLESNRSRLRSALHHSVFAHSFLLLQMERNVSDLLIVSLH